MKQAIGQILRLSGFGLEMWGIYSLYKDQPALPAETAIAGYFPTVAIGLGFVVWISGTVIIYLSRRSEVGAASLDVEA